MERVRLNKLSQKLILNEWNVWVCHDKNDATDYVAELCKGKVIGLGDSHTISDIGLLDRLQQNGETIFACQLDKSRENKLKTLNSEIFILSANAISEETGEMVNVDSSCNRVAASLYGPSEVVFIVGTNKIVKNLEHAIYRARNIAAPANAKIHNYNTPCVVTGKCEDCLSKDRICRATVIYHKRPKPMKGTVVLINDSLGY
jgi:L-lactate utilization protein LutB